MTLKFEELFQKTKKISLSIEDDSIDVEYRINAYTPELETMLKETDVQPAQTLAKIIERLVESWTLLDSDEKMYPIDENHLQKLPLPFLLAVFQAIAMDMRPNLLTVRDSEGI